MGKLIIDGNSVYSVDEECLKRRQIPETCGIREAVKRQEQKDKMAKRGRWQIKTGAGFFRLPFIWKWCSFPPWRGGIQLLHDYMHPHPHPPPNPLFPQSRSRMIIQQQLFPPPHPLPPKMEEPSPHPQQERSRIIQIMELHPHPLSDDGHPQFVAAKSLISDLQNWYLQYSLWHFYKRVYVL